MRDSRPARQYLEDMLEATEKALSYTSGMDRDRFLGDEFAVLVISRLLEIVGEAAKNVPERVRTAHPRDPLEKDRRDPGYPDPRIFPRRCRAALANSNRGPVPAP